MVSEGARPRWAAWALGVGFIVAAWLVALITPGDDAAQAPFAVPATIGQEASGRNITATITDLRRADEVSESEGSWSAGGNWLVVELDVASVLSERGTLLSHAVVEIDGVRYRASERPETVAGKPLAAGIPQTGSLAFELPEGLGAGSGTLELALDGDTRLDSMIVLPFELADVPRVDAAELLETGWSNP